MPQGLGMSGTYGLPGMTGDPMGGGSDPSGGGGSSQPAWMRLLPLLMTGVSTIGNIMGQQNYNSMMSLYPSLMKQYMNMTPAMFQTMLGQMTQPMSQALIKGVGNAVQGEAAERGLATAPGVYGTMLSQALAPYQIQEQQLGLQALMGKLGLPTQVQLPFYMGMRPPQADMSGLLRMLMQMYPGGGQAAPQSLTNTDPTGLMGLTPAIAPSDPLSGMSPADQVAGTEGF